MDDMALLREYATRDSEAAFETLVLRRVNFVYSAALRQVRDPHLAEEITQAVFVILAQKAGRISDKTILTGWLFRTTRFTAIAHARSAAKRQHREQEAYVQSEIQQSAPDPLWEQMSPLLDEALATLGENDRQAVLLRFFENKSLAEVGTSLGTGEDTARKRVSRALEKLRGYYSRRGIASTTAIIAAAISANSVQAAPVALAKSVTAVAVAKGAAVGGSTLTLIKGALKIMAWTKAKTAIVVGAGVLLTAGTATVTFKTIAEHRLDESWRIPNPNPDSAPQLVKILPTKFDRNVSALNVGSRGDNWVGVGQRVTDIVRVAHAWRPGRILFADPQPEDRYDFISTLPSDSGSRLQATLERKLGFVAHRETRETDVLVLKVRKRNAPGLKPPTNGGRDFGGAGRYYCDNSPLSSDAGWFPGISRYLEDYFKTPIVDQTGLTQNFNIDLRFNERWSQDSNHDALKQALLDQLGLELVPGREPIEMLVVEKVK